MKYLVSACFYTKKPGNKPGLIGNGIVLAWRQFNDRTQAQEWPQLHAKKNGWTVGTIISPRVEEIK